VVFAGCEWSILGRLHSVVAIIMGIEQHLNHIPNAVIAETPGTELVMKLVGLATLRIGPCGRDLVEVTLFWCCRMGQIILGLTGLDDHRDAFPILGELRGLLLVASSGEQGKNTLHSALLSLRGAKRSRSGKLPVDVTDRGGTINWLAAHAGGMAAGW
jgi:hypothetical protein